MARPVRPHDEVAEQADQQDQDRHDRMTSVLMAITIGSVTAS